MTELKALIENQRFQTALAGVLSCTLIGILSFTFLARTEFFNPFDENSHYDYVVRIASEGTLPGRDAVVTQQALADWACSGTPGFERLECGAPEQRAVDAPWEGANTATRYFPSYYVLTALPTRILHDVLGAPWLDSARFATTCWLLALALGLVLLTRALGLNAFAALAASLLACSMPLVVTQGVSLNNDVAAAAVSVFGVWTWLRLRSSSPTKRLVLSGGLALFAMTIKETALVCVLCIALLEWGHRQATATGDRPQQSVRAATGRAIALLASVLGSYIVLLYVLDPLVRGPASVTAEQSVSQVVAAAEPQQWGAATAKAFGYLTYSLQSAGFLPVFSGPWAQVLPVLIAMVVVGSLAFRVLRTSWPWSVSPVSSLGQAVLVFLAAFPVLTLMVMKVSGLPLVFQPRYYLAGMVLSFALLFEGLNRAWSIAVLSAAAIVYGFMLSQVL